MEAVETIQCPHCWCRMSTVVQTRETMVNGMSVRVRERICRNCKTKFRTKEIVDPNIKLPPNKRGKKSNPYLGNVFGQPPAEV